MKEVVEVVDIRRSAQSLAEMKRRGATGYTLSIPSYSIYTSNPESLMITLDRTEAEHFVASGGWEIVASRTLEDPMEEIA